MKSIFTTSLFLIMALNLFSQTPPRAYDVAIQGSQHVNGVLTGIYSYADTNNRPEGNSIYRWYKADSVTQTNPVAIDSAFYISYVVDSTDLNKYLAFEVTPVATGADSTVGTPVIVWTSLISFVGINDKDILPVAFFPNPATSVITFITSEQLSEVEIFTMEGKKIITRIMESNVLNVSMLHSGSYVIHVKLNNGQEGTARLLKH